MSIRERVSGLAHIGIPTNDLTKTIRFFESIGFEMRLRTATEKEQVAFLQLGNVMIETYENGMAALKPGAIEHIALDVDDIEAVYAEVRGLGYKEFEDGIQFLPFWEHGVRFFTIAGPNGEKIEFSQILDR
ncbi:MAG: VOC family protein [Clostridia bacterium]|nr:VOC family protein [Clostridia bacterium]